MQMKYIWIMAALLVVLPSVTAAPLLTGATRQLIALTPFIIATSIFLVVAFFLQKPHESAEAFNAGLMEVMVASISAIVVFIAFSELVYIFLGLSA